ncbi:MAG: hypothetical protein H0V17_16535 [Deltaproteobacteria bacterium]|nr:hypothetical protein [Deltaproteobacteria bacterium]
MRIISILFELLLIVGGIVAASSLIVAKKPDAKAILDKLVPFQALIGLVLIAFGIIFFVMLGPVTAFKAIKEDALPAMANLGGVLIAIVLGFVFALPQIIRAAPGAEQRANDMAQRIAPFQLLLGLLAAACGAIGLLHNLGILGAAKNIGLAP